DAARAQAQKLRQEAAAEAERLVREARAEAERTTSAARKELEELTKQQENVRAQLGQLFQGLAGFAQVAMGDGGTPAKPEAAKDEAKAWRPLSTGGEGRRTPCPVTLRVI